MWSYRHNCDIVETVCSFLSNVEIINLARTNTGIHKQCERTLLARKQTLATTKTKKRWFLVRDLVRLCRRITWAGRSEQYLHGTIEYFDPPPKLHLLIESPATMTMPFNDGDVQIVTQWSNCVYNAFSNGSFQNAAVVLQKCLLTDSDFSQVPIWMMLATQHLSVHWFLA